MSEDTIVFPCPACGTKYSVGPHHAGKKTTCKKCGAPVTVPTPQVANPTFIGGTRTIRRSDIDAMTAARADGPAMEEAPEVDMKGGASVMRKDETLYGQQVPQETSAGTRVPAPRRGPTTGPAGRPAPAPHAPAHQGRQAHGGAPRKKSPMPMYAGIGGGALVVIVIIVVIIASSGPGGGTQGFGNQIAVTGNTPAGNATTSKSQQDILLTDLRTHLNNIDALKVEDIESLYKQAKEHKSRAEFKELCDGFARGIAGKAGSADAPTKARLGLMLDTDGYPTGKNLMRQALESLEAGKTSRRTTPDGKTVTTFVKNELFVQVATRLGWKEYRRPAAFDDYRVLGIEHIADYDDAYAGIPQGSRDVELVAPELIEKLLELENKVKAAGKDLEDQHSKDGFAKNARAAFLRFLESNKAGKVNRKKNQRAFSPEAMQRPDEKVDQIWTYTYWKPFIVFVERPVGGGELDPKFKESLAARSALLQHLHEYFRTNLVDKFNLQRVKPRYNAALAEKEGWPLEIVVLKDSPTFEQFVEDVNDGRRIPGARAFYSPLNERVMTFDDTDNPSPETEWFNDSVVIHETFHLLSDHYAAGPMFEEAEMRTRPRYTSILVQEGLTDSISGFTRSGGDGRDAKYQFLTQNHLRLKDWQGFYERIGKKMLFRIQDMVECRNYGQCQQKAVDRWQQLGLRFQSQAHVNWVAQVGLGMFYASSCQASYFFETYQEGGKYIYRDKWWQFVAKDYKGEIQLSSFSDTKAIDAFKQMFGIKTDKDWEALDKKFEDYTVKLKPENVGRSAGPDIKEEEGYFGPAYDANDPFWPSQPEDRAGKPNQRQQAALRED
ncbi:MAG: hypothetical protein KF754_11470 [Planctomycetes bacterium]|nr:hypothetical protein [Planctomycetota bacterium]